MAFSSVAALTLAACSSSSSAQGGGSGAPDPTVTDTAACAKIVPAHGIYGTNSTTAVPSCFAQNKLSDWFDGTGFANRGTAVQFNSDDLCQADTSTCNIKASCGVSVNLNNVGNPAHVDFVGVWQDEKHFTGTLSLSVPSLGCSGKVAVSGSAIQ
jgi:hypothetical protein